MQSDRPEPPYQWCHILQCIIINRIFTKKSPESTCSDLTVLPPPSFLPIPSYELNSRWRSILPLEPKEWEEEVFHLSFAAHFYSGTTANK